MASEQSPGGRRGASSTGRDLSRARLALQDAARALAGDSDPSAASPPAEVAPARRRRTVRVRRRTSALLGLDEVYVGRPGLGEQFAYRDASGEVVADVEVVHLDESSKVDALLAGEDTDHVDERWVVVERGAPLFSVERYRPAEHPSYCVFAPDGQHLGTYLSEGGLLHQKVVVREEASAPAATIQTRHHRHVIVEADGRELGWCWRDFSAFGNDDDDELWGLRIEGPPALLDRRALLAAPLVCHLMAFPKRHFDRDGELAMLLVVTVPPVGLALAGAERAVDALHWFRRRFE